jgi:hypothetical protein
MPRPNRTPQHTDFDAIEHLPIKVLELHIHDEDVCEHCGYPPALDGDCVCCSLTPVPSLFVMAYLDYDATRAANDHSA